MRDNGDKSSATHVAETAEGDLKSPRLVSGPGARGAKFSRSETGVITRADVTDQLVQIKTPALTIVGDQDVASVPAQAKMMQAHIPNSKLGVIPGAGQLSNVEEPVAVTAASAEFLSGLGG